MNTVYVGLSGGVDSSVTAALLKEQGYLVVGVYMKNWTQDVFGVECPWREDMADAKAVAARLEIPFKVFDFQKEYKEKVVDYMVREYREGRTPNPDIMCNQEVKFKLFLEACLADGADLIATGHYSRLKPLAASPAGTAEPTTPRSSRRSALSESSVLAPRTEVYESLRASAHPSSSSGPVASGGVGLFAGVDANKDQSYFLYRVTSSALEKSLMPIGELHKSEVRKLAAKYSLPTAKKPDSQGICFIGEVGIKDFLAPYIELKKGPIVLKSTGTEIGSHDGVAFYTTGQRHGLGIGGGKPYYVIGKNVKTNTLYVTNDPEDLQLSSSEFAITDVHWIKDEPVEGKKYLVRTRHRGKLIPGQLKKQGNDWRISLQEPERAVTAGQSAVIYDAQRVLGGGIVT